MPLHKILLSLALGIASLGALRAANPAPQPQRTISGDITLERAIDIALRQNPEVLRATREIERVRGQVIEVRAQALPHLSTTSTYTKTDRNLFEISSSQNFSSSGTDSTTSSTSSSSVNDSTWRVALDLKQALYTGGQIRAAVRIARFTEDSSYWTLRDTIDRIVGRVRTQFVNVLRSRALIQVQEESIQLLTNQLKDQQNRFDAGTVPRFNVLRAEVALSNARPELIRARNNSLIAQLELARSLGLEPGHDGKPAFHCIGTLDTPARSLSITEALQIAKERRPFLKVQRQNILIETEQIKVAMAGYKPRLDANAGYEFRNSRLSNDLGDTVNGWFLGLTGRWDIFDGLATYGRTKQAHARLASAKINYDDSVLQVELEVQQAFALLQQARETIQSQRKAVEQALESLRLANERLAAGAGTQLDVLDARVALTQARTTELQARADYNTALAEFDRATATNTAYEESFRDPITTARTQSQKPSHKAQSGTPKSVKPTQVKGQSDR